MHVFRLFVMLCLLIAGSVPLASVAQTSATGGAMAGVTMRPTKDQVETAIRATNPTLRQLKAMKPIVQTYKSQVASAPDDASKQGAAKQMMAAMKTVLSPAQQATFKQSLVSQMMASH